MSILIILLIWTSAVGLLFYILIASVFSFKKPLYTFLYPKPSSFASKAPSVLIEAENIATPSSDVQVIPDKSAYQEKAVSITKNRSLIFNIEAFNAPKLLIRVAGDSCKGPPHMKVLLDNSIILQTFVINTSWEDFSLFIQNDNKKHTLSVGFDNELSDSSCKRVLKVDQIRLEN